MLTEMVGDSKILSMQQFLVAPILVVDEMTFTGTLQVYVRFVIRSYCPCKDNCMSRTQLNVVGTSGFSDWHKSLDDLVQGGAPESRNAVHMNAEEAEVQRRHHVQNFNINQVWASSSAIACRPGATPAPKVASAKGPKTEWMSTFSQMQIC